jgi:hypothetical protein
MLSFGPNISNIEDYNMKILNAIWNFFVAIGEAKYAADLARNGKYKEAQACYADNQGICRGL